MLHFLLCTPGTASITDTELTQVYRHLLARGQIATRLKTGRQTCFLNSTDLLFTGPLCEKCDTCKVPTTTTTITTLT